MAGQMCGFPSTTASTVFVENNKTSGFALDDLLIRCTCHTRARRQSKIIGSAPAEGAAAVSDSRWEFGSLLDRNLRCVIWRDTLVEMLWSDWTP